MNEPDQVDAEDEEDDDDDDEEEGEDMSVAHADKLALRPNDLI